MIDQGSNKTESLCIDSPQLEGDWELVEAHVEEYERYAEEERVRRDSIQEQIARGEYGPPDATSKEIVEPVVPLSGDPEYQNRHSWWQWLRTYVTV